MPVVAIDISQPQKIERELADANRRLAQERETPAAIKGLVEELADGLVELSETDLAGIDPYLIVSLQRAVLGATRALDTDDPDEQRRQLRYRLEQMRHVFRDLASGQAVDEERSSKEIAHWLVGAVDVPQRQLADLLGVKSRTFQRWISETEASAPDGDDARRLRLVARIVNQLRHSLTGVGVIRWFERPRDDLGGARPADLLDEPDAIGRLLTLASGARSSAAA
jgi:DNA-binding transcriptional regulator YiaG